MQVHSLSLLGIFYKVHSIFSILYSTLLYLPTISTNRSKMHTSHSNPSSEAGSVSSQGNSPQIPQGFGHQYKKSLSSKADPNTALQESHDPSMSTPFRVKWGEC